MGYLGLESVEVLMGGIIFLILLDMWDFFLGLYL